MIHRVRGDGPMPNRLMIIGERPGPDEHEQGRGFVGPSGQELWKRIWKICKLTRADFYVTNLVKTFSMEPPTDEEIARDADILRAELLRVRPAIILTIGYHAARQLLPQFKEVRGEFFSGLAFEFHYGKAVRRCATVVPIVHAAAALRSPDRYQNQLSDDLRAVKRVLDGAQAIHVAQRPSPYRVGLAGFGKEGFVLGVDTEGSQAAPECVTLAHNTKECCLVEVYEGHKQFLAPSLSHAKAWAIHYALHDVPILKSLGARVPVVHDTMLEAYLLGLPQSLKVLAYRELGYEMSEYSDLVDPLDEQLVKTTLLVKAEQWTNAHIALEQKAVRIEVKKAQGKRRVTKKAIAARYKKLLRTSDAPPLRVVKGVQRMIARTDADNSRQPQDGE